MLAFGRAIVEFGAWVPLFPVVGPERLRADGVLLKFFVCEHRKSHRLGNWTYFSSQNFFKIKISFLNQVFLGTHHALCFINSEEKSYICYSQRFFENSTYLQWIQCSRIELRESSYLVGFAILLFLR